MHIEMHSQRKMKLGLFLFPPGHYATGWRHPDTPADAPQNVPFIVRLAQTAERGLLDFVFVADTLSVSATFHPSVKAALEPFTLLSLLAGATERIGLVATACATYNEPYPLARLLASLDHISGGRAAWNVVTSDHEATAANFGREAHLPHDERYERAAEFVEAVRGLWDSWEDDAFLRDQANDVYYDPGKLHTLDHRGKHLRVKGPLNIARPPQGHPVLVQAGSSAAGQAFAAACAEAMFTVQNDLPRARLFYSRVKDAVEQSGRPRDALKIMPGLIPFIGSTEAEAQAKYERLRAFTDPAAQLQMLSHLLGGVDLSGYPPDGLLPDPLPIGNREQTRPQLLIELARRERLTIRQLLVRAVESRGHSFLIGTPEQIADYMQEWFLSGGADGFNVMPPYFPEGLDLFVDEVVPLLRRRGLFREEYEEGTLRDRLGLARPANRFAISRAQQ